MRIRLKPTELWPEYKSLISPSLSNLVGNAARCPKAIRGHESVDDSEVGIKFYSAIKSVFSLRYCSWFANIRGKSRAITPMRMPYQLSVFEVARKTRPKNTVVVSCARRKPRCHAQFGKQPTG
jgi:hypothetical protein